MTTLGVGAGEDNKMARAVAAAKNATPKKSMLEQILEWSETLPAWQRDALRRLFVRSSAELTPADYEELYALLKRGNGLTVTSGVVAMPWAREHLPNTAGSSQHAKLKAMRDLKYVNKIAAGQVLEFALQGMTIIYGGNGSGKSGYSRVLKRACRARDQSEPVHPDATDPAQIGKIPEACFDIDLDGKAKTVAWRLTDAAPDDLSTIAVFDGKCARAYVNSEGDVAYMPFGLDVVTDLANKILPALDGMLSKELDSIAVDLSILDVLRGDTKVGKVIEEFGPKTEEDVLTKLAALNDSEAAKLSELDKTLAQEDPSAAAKKVRLERQRMMELVTRINAACAVVSDVAVEKLKRLDAEDVIAAKAVETAANMLRSGEQLLPGTGDEVWQMMFDAAKRYSTEVAYPGHSFPHTAADAVCPLCQQGVAEAADRLKRFDDFLKQDTARVAANARRAVGEAVRVFRTASVSFGINDSLATEVAAVGGGVLDAVKAFENSVSDRQRSMLASLAAHDWKAVSVTSTDPRPILQQHAADLAIKAEELEKAGDAEKRELMVRERDELKARATLKKELARVTKLLANVKARAALEACKRELKTTGISSKAKTLAEEAVTAALREALDREFDKLGGVPKPKVADRIDKGKAKYKLQFAGVTRVALEEILSEGEQRAMAIGSFLAELGIAEHKGAIVFDDPVSSLDHQRKTHIAGRLAEEAKVRQVIVFTHDLVFLSLLADAVEKGKVGHVVHWLEKDGSGVAGKITLNDSPVTSDAYSNTRLARTSIASAKKLSGSEAVAELRRAAGQLRRTVEEVVPKHLFKNVVARWRENYMLTRVKLINWDTGVADEVDALFGELSRLVEGHSHSEEYSGGVPDVSELTKLTDRVEAVLKAAKKERA
jgi:energy-coupling factor transporter ATP-binding protein EcfA2